MALQRGDTAAVPSQHTALMGDATWGLKKLSGALNLTCHEGPIIPAGA